MCEIRILYISMGVVFFLLPGKLYGDPDYLEERHRHRFEVNPVLKKCLEEQGLKFVGQDVGGERMEIVELEGDSSGCCI